MFNFGNLIKREWLKQCVCVCVCVYVCADALSLSLQKCVHVFLCVCACVCVYHRGFWKCACRIRVYMCACL